MKSDDIHIRSAKEEDQQGILTLLNNVFSENQRSATQRDSDYWNWKFKSNVFGSSLLHVAELDNEIVGVDHLWPWELKAGEEIIRAYQPCDSAVASECRGRGIFTRLRKKGIQEAEKRKHQLIFNFPNENSLPVNLRIGAQHLGKITWRLKVFRPFRMMMGVFGGNLSSPIEIDQKFNLDIDKLDYISTCYDDFGRFLETHRKPGFYKWRYEDRPNRDYGMLSIEEKNKMVAAIFTINQKGSSREMVMVDMVGDQSLSHRLFTKIVEAAKKLDVSFLALMENPRLNTHELWKSGFIKKKMKNMAVFPLDTSIEKEVLNMEAWALSAGLHDSI